GAAAMSVLTDGPGFQGCLEDLIQARKSVALPVLRKDFILSSYQLYESVMAGADAVLLIVRILSQEQLHDYLTLCQALLVDALVEVHSEEEIETATRAGARLIGINNRNLRSFKTDIAIAENLARQLEPDQVAVAESGIRTREDIRRLVQSGIWNFLIGESLVRSKSPKHFIEYLAGIQISGGEIQ
ncbi:indole-3-glycerol-phosphate synthase, partial [bacterium]|nr:indole-3-glycerol-phosphate synthase [bacterium]